MWCANHDDQNLTTGLCAHGITRASIHVLRFMCAVWKVLWVLVVTLSFVSCVLSVGFTTQTAIPSVEFFPSGYCSPIVHL